MDEVETPIADSEEHGFIVFASNCLTDIQSNDREVAERLCRLIKREEPDPEQLMDFLTSYDSYGMTPLHWAGKNCNSDLMVVLVNPILDHPNLYDVLRMEVLAIDENSMNRVGDNLFHLNIRHGSTNLISMARKLEVPCLDAILMESNGGDPVICLAAAHSLQSFKGTVDGGSHILIKDSCTMDEGWTAAHIAAINRNTDEGKGLLKYILDRLPTPEIKNSFLSLLDKCGRTAMHRMAQRENVEGMETIFQEVDETGRRALLTQRVAQPGPLDQLTLLHLNLISNDGSTKVAAHLADQLPDGEWQNILMHQDPYGDTPLNVAINHQYPGLIVLLSEFSGEVRTDLLKQAAPAREMTGSQYLDSEGETFYEILSKILDPAHSHKNSLHYSAALGDVEVAKFILDHMPSSLTTRYLKAVNNVGENFLHIAAAHNQYQFLQEIFRHLVNRREELDELLTEHSSAGLSPLHVSARKDDLEFIFKAFQMQVTVEGVRKLLRSRTSSNQSLADFGCPRARYVIKELEKILSKQPDQLFSEYPYDLDKIWDLANLQNDDARSLLERFKRYSDDPSDMFCSTFVPRMLNWKAVLLHRLKDVGRLESVLIITSLCAGKLQHLINLSRLRTRQGRCLEAMFLAFDFYILQNNSTCRLLSQSAYACTLAALGNKSDLLLRDALRINQEVLDDPQMDELSQEHQWEVRFEYMKLLPQANRRVPTLTKQDKINNNMKAAKILLSMKETNEQIKRFQGESSSTQNFDLTFDIWVAELLQNALYVKDQAVLDFWHLEMNDQNTEYIVECALEEAIELYRNNFVNINAPTWSRIGKVYKDLYNDSVDQESSDRYYQESLRLCDESLRTCFDVMAAFTKVQLLIEKRARIYMAQAEARGESPWGRNCPRYCRRSRVHFRFHLETRERDTNSETYSLVKCALELSDEIFAEPNAFVKNDVVRMRLMYAIGRPLDDIQIEALRHIDVVQDDHKVDIFSQLGWLYVVDGNLAEAEHYLMKASQLDSKGHVRERLEGLRAIQKNLRGYLPRSGYRRNERW